MTGKQKPTDVDQKVALAADWARRPDLHPWLFEIFKMSEINTPKDQLYRQKTHLQLNPVAEDGVVENNLIGSTRNLATLESLHNFGERTSNLLVCGCTNLIRIAALIYQRIGQCSQGRPRDSPVANHSTEVGTDVGGNSIHSRCTLPAAARSFGTTTITVIEGNVDVSRGALLLC